jgi:hypothetical protein
MKTNFKVLAFLFSSLLLFPSLARAGDAKEFTLSPTEATGLFAALQLIGTKERICKDGAIERPCKEPVAVPPGLSLVIARDIRALRGVIEDYQYAQRNIIAAASGGSGYLEPRSKQEAEASQQVTELGRKPLKVTLTPISAKELEDAKLGLSPDALSNLLPILQD